MVASYEFKYPIPQRRAIQKGPLGEAHEVIVRFSPDKIFLEMEWIYTEGFRFSPGTGVRTPITNAEIEALGEGKGFL